MNTKEHYDDLNNNNAISQGYELGQKDMLKKLQSLVQGMVVNGTIKGVILEEDLKELEE